MNYFLIILISLIISSQIQSAPDQASPSIEINKTEILKRSILAELKMTSEKMETVLKSNGIEFDHKNNSISFMINQQQLMIVYDENADRMRIICPIADLKDITTDHLIKAMEANFHTNLDSRYAISDGIVWSVFIHPLSDLSEELFISAINQTYNAMMTFGNEYSSGYLSFPKKEKTKESAD